MAVVVALTPRVGFAMLFRPSPEFRLWDTWLYIADDEFHLYFAQGPAGGRHNSIGHAVSPDLIHWKSLGSVVQHGPSEWERYPRYASGTVIRHGDRHLMFQAGRGRGIGITMMSSTDLHQWTKHPDDPVFTITDPYYDRIGDPYVYRVSNGYEMLCQARLPGPVRCIARLFSKDLMHWETRPPIATPKVSQHEVPEYFPMGGKHYLTFSACGGRPGCVKSDLVVDTESRRDTAGTYYVIADEREGPYVMPEDSLFVGSGNGRIDSYVARTFLWNGQRMVYYHNVGLRPGGCDPVLSQASLAAPKIVRQNADGALWNEYWPGLAGLETGILVDTFQGSTPSATGWTAKPNVLVGRKSNTAPFMLARVAADAHLTCTVNLEPAGRAAVIVRYDDQSKVGTALVLDAMSGDVEVTRMEDGRFTMLDAVASGIEAGESYKVRIFARAEFVDWYVDDRLVFSTAINDVPLIGRIGFAVDNTTASFTHLRIAALEELP